MYTRHRSTFRARLNCCYSMPGEEYTVWRVRNTERSTQSTKKCAQRSGGCQNEMKRKLKRDRQKWQFSLRRKRDAELRQLGLLENRENERVGNEYFSTRLKEMEDHICMTREKFPTRKQNRFVLGVAHSTNG